MLQFEKLSECLKIVVQVLCFFYVILSKGRMSRRKEYDLFSMEKNREKWRLKVKTAVMTLGKTFSYTPL